MAPLSSEFAPSLSPPRGVSQTGSSRAGRWVCHLLCVVALMWTALVNGQPFFFPDTTSYIRSADLAVFLASDHRLSTAWTARYADGLTPKMNADAQPQTEPTQKQPQTAHSVGNDVSSGNIMAGRSPYIGALLYLAYVASNFWLFVVGQALVAYWLIILALRRFGVEGQNVVTGVVLILAATTSLPYFNGLLLADAFASFGILAFLLLATDTGALRRRDIVGLGVIVLISAISHLTHIVMLFGMTAALAVMQLVRFAPWQRRALWIGAGCVVAGFASLSLTSYAVKSVFHRPPQLVPLMTARFIDDGPGGDFIRAGCNGYDFVVCHMPVDKLSSQDFLWSTEPNSGGFLTATPEQRARMSAEDTRFAIAVWKAYPLRQTGMIAYNSLRQMLTFPYEGLNVGCFAKPDCWASLPPETRDQLRDSLSGRNMWPGRTMTLLLYFAVGLAVVVITLGLPAMWRSRPAEARAMTAWLILGFIPMAICDILGGAVSEPQYRYQGRLIWLVVLFGVIVFLVNRRNAVNVAHSPGNRVRRPQKHSSPLEAPRTKGDVEPTQVLKELP